MNIFIVLMVIYIVAMLILGYLGSKRATDSTSYATSNGDVSVFNVSITFAATFASAGTFLRNNLLSSSKTTKPFFI